MDFWEFLLALGVVAFTVDVKGIEDSPCSTLNRKIKLKKCLDSIRERVKDRTLFWFGNRYPDKCDQSLAFVADCYNPSPNRRDSLLSRVYKDGKFNTNTLDRFLEVTYQQNSGSYFACENDFENLEERIIPVDPFSNDMFTPWQLREAPVFKWKTEKEHLYTLIFYDVGYKYIKSFIINIPGSNVTDGEIILPYEGPLNPTRNRNPYLFLLFKQSGYMRLGPDWRHILYQRSSAFHLSEFGSQYNLTGPIALNWIQVTGDPYAAERKQISGYMNTCPHFVSDAFNRQNLLFLPHREERFELSVYINVTFTSPHVTFNSCCSIYKYPASIFTLNPLGNGHIKAANVRSNLHPVISLSMATAFPSIKRDFKGTLLTLMVVDSDSPFPVFGDKVEPFLHWLVVNIDGGNVTNGDTVMPYIGPAPPNPEPHTYHYLLFEQHDVLHPSEIAEYANKNCSFAFKGRCRFKSKTAIDNHNLKLIGATWHLTGNDEYVRHLYMSLGMRSCDVCDGVKGFSVPCVTTGTGDTVNPSGVVFVLLFITFYML